MATALITGIEGQDGLYLADLLRSKGYRVIGTRPNRENRDVDNQPQVEIVELNLLDERQVESILREYRPNEVYNLAARASSRELWAEPLLTGKINALAVTCLLEGIIRIDHKIRFIQACSSEVFGNTTEVPQHEGTPFSPRNPYGVAKAYAHWTTAIYREHRGLFACSAILYNHESPRRGPEFVTRKVSRSVARIKMGLARELRLGDLEARRDWGFAGDYVRAMWLALQHPAPDDYIIATGETHSVREFCDLAFSHAGLNYRDYVVQDRQNLRPAESVLLVGNPEKAKRLLGWNPTVTFQDLVRMMVDADLKLVQNAQQTCIRE
jgi:GDPmannose 4,6-dehydratase